MKTIHDVLSKLESVIEWTKVNESPLGYFAAVYYKMTVGVRDGIQNGIFEDGPRMERLDMIFAQRYFDAMDDWMAGKTPSNSWRVAFEASRNPNLLVLQQIILGINAHINLDLGVAAATTAPGAAIYGLQSDFNKINDTIAGLTDRVQDRLADIWLPFRWLDYLLKTEDEGWINFSIKVARGASWQTATLVAQAPDEAIRQQLIQTVDNGVVLLADKIQNPGFWMNQGISLMRRGEKGTVRQKIELLEAI